MRTALTSLLAAAVTVVALGNAAEARINGPRFDSFSIGCGSLQDEADQLIADYQNASNPRREEILTRLRVIGGLWNDSGCGAVFGGIALGVGLPRLPAVSIGDAVRFR